MYFLIFHMTLHKSSYNKLRPKFWVSFDRSYESWYAINYIKTWYACVSNIWLCFFFSFRFFIEWMKLVKLFNFNVFFFSFWITFSWSDIGGLIIVLDWFTREWSLPPCCLFVRNKDNVEACVLVESSFLDCSCITICTSSEFFFVFSTNIDKIGVLWNK